jgi:hypothetical protein
LLALGRYAVELEVQVLARAEQLPIELIPVLLVVILKRVKVVVLQQQVVVVKAIPLVVVVLVLIRVRVALLRFNQLVVTIGSVV